MTYESILSDLTSVGNLFLNEILTPLFNAISSNKLVSVCILVSFVPLIGYVISLFRSDVYIKGINMQNDIDLKRFSRSPSVSKFQADTLKIRRDQALNRIRNLRERLNENK